MFAGSHSGGNLSMCRIGNVHTEVSRYAWITNKFSREERAVRPYFESSISYASKSTFLKSMTLV